MVTFLNGNLTVGDGSEIQGEVKAKNITMSGNVLGKVTAQEKIRLESKGVLKRRPYYKIPCR